MPPTSQQRNAVRELPTGRVVMRQRWNRLLFLHWPTDPAAICERLPAGLHPDLFDGQAWIGLVPFFMERIRPSGLPVVPWLSWFLELNVRTYVHDDAGNPGVWFFSLDCNQPLAVEIARRAFHLPYQHAAMRAKITGDRVSFRSRRMTPGTAEALFEYRLPANPQPAVPDSLEWFLVERYLLFSTNRAGNLFSGRVHHEPYRIERGDCEKWSPDPLILDGLPPPAGPPASILTAAPLDVRIFPLRPVALSKPFNALVAGRRLGSSSSAHDGFS